MINDRNWLNESLVFVPIAAALLSQLKNGLLCEALKHVEISTSTTKHIIKIQNMQCMDCCFVFVSMFVEILDSKIPFQN